MESSMFARLELALEREIYKNSFYEFYKAAFCQLHPGLAYDENWHAKYICDILQKETERVIAKLPREKDLIINVPPRSSKSMIVTVIWPVWSWTKDPTLKFLRCSYSDTIATILSRQSKDLIVTNWFQRLYGNRVILRGDLSGAGHFGNTKTGFMYAFGIDGTVTGIGGDFIICFREDQKVLTESGEIEIGRIVNERMNVKVASFNHETNQIEYKPIVTYFKNEGKRLLKIKTKSGKEIVCTENHPIWTENRGYVEARDLRRTDTLKYVNKESHESPESIDYLDEIPEFVYNLEVEDNNNYFVNGALVHNCDDPANPRKANSETERAATIERYDGTISNRLNQLEIGGRIIVMQRLHQQDLCGYLLDPKTGRSEDFTHICIPAEYDANLVKPIELAKYYEDGKYFWKSRFSEKVLSTERKKGTLYFSGQFQQTPVPPEGNLFKRAWIDIIPAENISRNNSESPIHFFIDTAYTEDETERNDPSGIFTCFKKDNVLYGINFVEVWMEFPKLIAFIKEYVHMNGYSGYSAIYIEPKASGKSVVQQLRSETNLNVIEIEAEWIRDDKVTRATAVSPIVEGRRLKLIQGEKSDWIDKYIGQLTSFPKAQHDEAVDTTVYALNYLLPANDFDYMVIEG